MPDPEDAPRDHHADETRNEGSDGERTSFTITGPVTIRLETIAHLLTAAVALSAILLSVWEGLENRRHNRLSVMPHLESIEASYASASPIELEYFRMLSSLDSLYAVSYALKNSGLGPAVLQNMLVFHGDTLVYDTAEDASDFFFSDVEGAVNELPFVTSVLKHPYGVGAMLKAGEIHDFLAVGIPMSAVDADTLDRWPPRIVIEDVLETYSFVFCYCSVYETNCDAVHLGGDPPVEKACGF